MTGIFEEFVELMITDISIVVQIFQKNKRTTIRHQDISYKWSFFVVVIFPSFAYDDDDRDFYSPVLSKISLISSISSFVIFPVMILRLT